MITIVDRRKCSEIVLALNQRGKGIHAILVQRIRIMAHEAALNR